MKSIFDAITVIASVMTIIAFVGLFITQDKFEYFIIVAISGLAAVDTLALSKINTLAKRLNKVEGR